MDLLVFICPCDRDRNDDATTIPKCISRDVGFMMFWVLTQPRSLKNFSANWLLYAQKKTHMKRCSPWRFCFQDPLACVLDSGIRWRVQSPHPPLIDAENGPSTRAVDSSREQDRSSAALQQTARAGKHKITPRICQDT